MASSWLQNSMAFAWMWRGRSPWSCTLCSRLPPR